MLAKQYHRHWHVAHKKRILQDVLTPFLRSSVQGASSTEWVPANAFDENNQLVLEMLKLSKTNMDIGQKDG